VLASLSKRPLPQVAIAIARERILSHAGEMLR
jgi:hypothetical protein